MVQTISTRNPSLDTVPSISVEGGADISLAAPSLYRMKIPDFSGALQKLMDSDFSPEARDIYFQDLSKLAYNAYSPYASAEERSSVKFINLNTNVSNPSPTEEMQNNLSGRQGFDVGGTVGGLNVFRPESESSPTTDASNFAGTIGQIVKGAMISNAPVPLAVKEGTKQFFMSKVKGADLSKGEYLYNTYESFRRAGMNNVFNSAKSIPGSINLAVTGLNIASAAASLRPKEIPGQIKSGVSSLGNIAKQLIKDPVGSVKTSIADFSKLAAYGTTNPTVVTAKGPYNFEKSVVFGPGGKVTTPSFVKSLPLIGSASMLGDAFMDATGYYKELTKDLTRYGNSVFAESEEGVSIGVAPEDSSRTITVNTSFGPQVFNYNNTIELIGKGNQVSTADIELGLNEKLSSLLEFKEDEKQQLLEELVDKLAYDTDRDKLESLTNKFDQDLLEMQMTDPERYALAGEAVPEEYAFGISTAPGISFDAEMNQIAFNPSANFIKDVRDKYSTFTSIVEPLDSNLAKAMKGNTFGDRSYLDYDDLDEFGEPSLSYDNPNGFVASLTDWYNDNFGDSSIDLSSVNDNFETNMPDYFQDVISETPEDEEIYDYTSNTQTPEVTTSTDSQTDSSGDNDDDDDDDTSNNDSFFSIPQDETEDDDVSWDDNADWGGDDDWDGGGDSGGDTWW